MKRYIVSIIIAVMCASIANAKVSDIAVPTDAATSKAASTEAGAANAAAQVGDDFKVIKDETVDGVRHIIAVPSSLVCSKQIDIDIDVKTKTIVGGRYYRGCSGNAQGIMALVKGMKIEEAISRLEGINCAGRGTSCPDQLAKVLKSLKW